MPKFKTPDCLLTDEQLMRRERNARYRAKKMSTESDKVKKMSQKKNPFTVVSNDLIETTSQSNLNQECVSINKNDPSCLENIELNKTRLNQIEEGTQATSNELIETLLKKIETLDQKIEYSELNKNNLTIKKTVAPDVNFKNVSFIFLLFTTFIFTGYLINQAISFFSNIDSNPTSAISSGIMSECIPFIAAILLALTNNLKSKFFLSGLLIVSIVSVSLFMHSSVNQTVTKNNPSYRRLIENRTLIIESIEQKSKSIKAIPPSYASKRLEISKGIEDNQKRLSELDFKLYAMENGSTNGFNINSIYSFWIRLGAMLLNIYMLHLLATNLKKR